MMFRTFFERQGFLKKLYDYFERDEKLDTNYRELESLRHAYGVLSDAFNAELEDRAGDQLQADIFQQALTNTFTEKRIQDFFDEADRLREEHDNAK